MGFRRRVVILVVLAVLGGGAAASLAVFLVVRHELEAQVDERLRALATGVRVLAPAATPPARRRERTARPPAFPSVLVLEVQEAALRESAGFAQVVRPDGVIVQPRGSPPDVPVDERTIRVARRAEPAYTRDARIAGMDVRILTTPSRDGAVQAVYPVGSVDALLSRVVRALIGIGVLGVVMATGLALLVTRAAAAPLRRLSATLEHVRGTQDLRARVPVVGGDELARLGREFNALLDTLERSLQARRRLVADASHELRTPLATVRASLELLGRPDALTPAERSELTERATRQVDELTELVADLIVLARDPDASRLDPEPVRLDLLVDDVIRALRVRHPGSRFGLAAAPTVVVGNRETLQRAVRNMLDNAVKWSPQGGTIEVDVRDGAVAVRDRGPGIAEQDLPLIFERFYRAPAARGRPGSGLGLAIVRQVAEAHDGFVTATNAEGGGARIELHVGTTFRPRR
jgi:two-component system sensor histidine kinase MprB